MYRASTGHRFIIVVTDEVTNYLVTVLLYSGISHEAGEALTNYAFCKHGPPSYLVFHKDQSFLSSVTQYIYKR